MCRAVRVGFGRARRGEKASLAHEEAVSRQTQGDKGDIVVEAAPAAALELGQADFLLEFAIRFCQISGQLAESAPSG